MPFGTSLVVFIQIINTHFTNRLITTQLHIRHIIFVF
nr:MAG TPA: hypothetical protein [Caudoviricetes sp.]